MAMPKSKKTAPNQWAKDALAGNYKFDSGGADKKGRRPGFSKAGSTTAKHEKKMKGKPPTHGADGSC